MEKKTNNILLVNPFVPGIVLAPPLGLGFLATFLAKNNYNVKIIDLAIDKLSLEKLSGRIKNEEIGIVGITMITPAVNEVMKIIDFLKTESPDLKIVVGGAHASIRPIETFNLNKNIDFLVIGEGEKALLEIANFINRIGNFDNAQGIAYRDNEKTIFKEGINYLDDLESFPVLDRKLIEFHKYSNLMFSSKKPVTSMMISRGCPYMCIYCSKPVTGSRVRERRVESVIEEIRMLKEQYCVKELVFYDDVFTFNRNKVIKLCEEMINNGFDISWKCETRVNLVDEELLKTMKNAGCYLIAYGIESGTQKMLNYLKKGITLEQVRNAINLTKKVGIKTQGYFMIGVPTENEEDIIQTINFAKSLPLDICQFSIATPYPGTELYDIAKERGITVENSKLIYSTSRENEIVSLCDLSPEVLKSLLKKAYKEFYLRPAFLMKKISELNFSNLEHNINGLKNLVKVMN